MRKFKAYERSLHQNRSCFDEYPNLVWLAYLLDEELVTLVGEYLTLDLSTIDIHGWKSKWKICWIIITPLSQYKLGSTLNLVCCFDMFGGVPPLLMDESHL